MSGRIAVPSPGSLNGASLGGHLGDVSGGLAWAPFGALAAGAELGAADGFKRTFQQRGQCESPLLGVGTHPTTLSGRRELSGRWKSQGHELHVAHLSGHRSHGVAAISQAGSNCDIPGWRPSLFFAAYVFWLKLPSAAFAHDLGGGVGLAVGFRVVPCLGQRDLPTPQSCPHASSVQAASRGRSPVSPSRGDGAPCRHGLSLQVT